MDIKEYLEDKGCDVRNRGVDHISTHCFFCEEETSKAGRLYINVDEYSDKYGVFFCFLCNEKGGINKIRYYYGDPPLEVQQNDVSSNPIFEVACQYYENRLMDNPKAYKFLMDDRAFNDEIIREARFGWADGGLCQFLIQKGYDAEDIKSTGLVNQFGEDYFHDEIIIPYLEYGIAYQLRGKKINGKYRSAQGSKAALYGTDYILGENTVAIAEGELASLHLNQIGIPAIGVPGAQTWKPEWTELLRDVKRVYIVYDADNAGKAGAEKVAKELGVKARIVEIPVAKIDIEDYIVKYDKNYDDIQYLFRKASGGLLVSMREAYDRWTEVEGSDNLAGLKFNVEPLDKAISFGILPAQVVTLLAKTGAGKSLMSINMFQRMKILQPDIKILYFTLEMTRNEIFERLYRIHQLYYPGSSVIDVMDYWEDNLILVDKNRISEHELSDSLEQAAFEFGEETDLFCVDYLGYFARGVSGVSEYDRTTNAIMHVKGIAKDTRSAALVPHQVNRTGTFGEELRADMAKSSGAVEETSDILFTQWAYDQKSDQDGHSQDHNGIVMQKVLKSRNGGVNTTVPYIMDPLTLAIVPTSDYEMAGRAKFMRQCAMAGDSWKEAVKRLESGQTDI